MENAVERQVGDSSNQVSVVYDLQVVATELCGAG
jgi:hypothetical protein